jgi:hypothetical protein
MISRAVPSSHRRPAATAQPHPVGRSVATGGGTVLTSMSQPRAQQCMHGPVPRSSPGRCPSRPGAIDPQNARLRRLALEGVGCTVARTEVRLGESLHDPGARCAGSSVSGHPLPSQQRGQLKGFGYVPGLSPGVAPGGDDARSQPPRPHRGDPSGSARGEPRSRRRPEAIPSPPQSRTGPSATHSHTPTVRSDGAWPRPRC